MQTITTGPVAGKQTFMPRDPARGSQQSGKPAVLSGIPGGPKSWQGFSGELPGGTVSSTIFAPPSNSNGRPMSSEEFRKATGRDLETAGYTLVNSVDGIMQPMEFKDGESGRVISFMAGDNVSPELRVEHLLRVTPTRRLDLLVRWMIIETDNLISPERLQQVMDTGEELPEYILEMVRILSVCGMPDDKLKAIIHMPIAHGMLDGRVWLADYFSGKVKAPRRRKIHAEREEPLWEEKRAVDQARIVREREQNMQEGPTIPEAGTEVSNDEVVDEVDGSSLTDVDLDNAILPRGSDLKALAQQAQEEIRMQAQQATPAPQVEKLAIKCRPVPGSMTLKFKVDIFQKDNSGKYLLVGVHKDSDGTTYDEGSENIFFAPDGTPVHCKALSLCYESHDIEIQVFEILQPSGN